MKKYLVKVNGQELEVEVEEVVQTTAKKVSPSPKLTNLKTTRIGSGEVLSPMPGAIIEIYVQVGDIVTENDTIVILEAMKMENVILAGKAGQIKEILVNVGQGVAAGELLVVID